MRQKRLNQMLETLVTYDDEDDRSQIKKVISSALREPRIVKSKLYNPDHDNLCTGLVTKIFEVYRRLQKFPFIACLISHSGIVCETSRNKAYFLEYVEDTESDILLHDVTDTWSFEPCRKWVYGGYKFTRDMGSLILAPSYNVQFVYNLFLQARLSHGDYVLSGNNCHLVQEEVRFALGIATIAQLDYSTSIQIFPLDFNPQSEMKPYYFM